MKKTRIICLVLLALCLASLGAAEKKRKKPTKSEVVVVASVQISPAPDYAFFANYNGYDPKEKTPFEPHVELVSEKKGTGETGPIGKVASYTFKLPKGRELLLYGFSAQLSSFHDTSVILPVLATIAVPEGTNYVYIGALDYKRSNDYFDIDAIEQSDDFDGAKEWVRREYGDEAAAALIRVPLKAKKFADK